MATLASFHAHPDDEEAAERVARSGESGGIRESDPFTGRS